MKNRTKTNLELIALIRDLGIAGEKNRIWRDIGKRLEKSRKNWTA